MADEQPALPTASPTKEDLEREMATARDNLAADASRLRQALSLQARPSYQLAQHPRIVLGFAAATGLLFAWLLRGHRRQAREREVLEALWQQRQRQLAPWWQRLLNR